MNIQAEALTHARLNARHGLPPMSPQELEAYCRNNIVEPEAVRMAEKEGRDLRASGARCLCPYCECNGDAIGKRERLRHEYEARRHIELQVAGVAAPNKRWRIISTELDAGAALQQGPVNVTRSAGVRR